MAKNGKNVLGTATERAPKHNHLTLKRIGAGALIFGALGAGAETLAAAASADTHIYVGGCGDVNADGIVGTYQQQGRYDYGANNIQVNYPASMAPVACADGNNTSTRDSIRIGADVTDAAINANMGDQVFVDTFSLGAGVGNQVGQDLVNQYGAIPGNVHITNNGNGWSAPGIQNGIAGEIASPITGLLNIPSGQELKTVPGMTNNTDVADIWGNGGAQGLNPGALIADVSSVAVTHRIPDPNEPHQTYTGYDGDTYNIFSIDNPDPLTAAVESQGVDVPQPLPLVDQVLDGNVNPAESPLYNPAVLGLPDLPAPAPVDAAPAPNPVADFLAQFAPPAPVDAPVAP